MRTLLTPFNLAGLVLPNRTVMAPMTRSRAVDGVPDAQTALYYSQRASAGLIVSEGIPVSQEGTGFLFNPGLYTDAQQAGWRDVTDAVHAAGGRIFAQLWHVGRLSHVSLQEDGAPPVSSVARRAESSSAYAWQQPGVAGQGAFRQAFRGTLVSAGGFDRDSAEAALQSGALDLVAFGRPFIANPDFVERITHGWPLAEAGRATFYGLHGVAGYTDYPTWQPATTAI